MPNDTGGIIDPRRRKPIQIATATGGQTGHRSFFALCDDGTIWQLVESTIVKEEKRIKTNWLPLDTRPLETADLFQGAIVTQE